MESRASLCVHLRSHTHFSAERSQSQPPSRGIAPHRLPTIEFLTYAWAGAKMKWLICSLMPSARKPQCNDACGASVETLKELSQLTYGSMTAWAPCRTKVKWMPFMLYNPSNTIPMNFHARSGPTCGLTKFLWNTTAEAYWIAQKDMHSNKWCNRVVVCILNLFA